MKKYLLILFFASQWATAQKVGGGCDGCELMYVGMPKTISSIDTSAGWAEKGQKLLITGTVYKIDGTTPAPDVIIYYWHTDAQGHYSPKGKMNEKAKRHGHIRGWVKTDKKGKYTIYTLRPAPYPDEQLPAHVHISIKEPSIKDEYYIDELVFDDDKLLIASQKKYPPENRGGSGILRTLISGSLQIAEHDIILGLHIPHYPVLSKADTPPGLPLVKIAPRLFLIMLLDQIKAHELAPYVNMAVIMVLFILWEIIPIGLK
ncbi:MAG: intradiol ring-cleavage dioxygenase [Spirosomataceae bacterium]